MSNFVDTQAFPSPAVSIIVTTFNRVHCLAETIDSNLSRFELIIVGDMPEEKTEGYVHKLSDSRISYYRNSNNGVISVNRNFGIEKTKGKYIALCDDDLWLPEKLDRQMSS